MSDLLGGSCAFHLDTDCAREQLFLHSRDEIGLKSPYIEVRLYGEHVVQEQKVHKSCRGDSSRFMEASTTSVAQKLRQMRTRHSSL